MLRTLLIAHLNIFLITCISWDKTEFYFQHVIGYKFQHVSMPGGIIQRIQNYEITDKFPKGHV